MTKRKDNLRRYLPDALVDELPDDAFVFDPEGLDQAIVNISDGRVVYDYEKLIKAYMEVFADEEDRDSDQLWLDAVDWVHYNTLRALPYMPLNARPIITGMDDEEDEEDGDGDDCRESQKRSV